ncbi:hypothetical protein GCM10027452_00020 [Micromonospora halotolerans]
MVCANDEIALGALGRGLRVPQDLVIAGFDDVPAAALVTPSLTTVRQPVRELTAQVARLILLATDQPGDTPAGSLVLPSELVLPRSCGCSAPPTGGTGR